MIAASEILLAGGVILIAWGITGYTPTNVIGGTALMILVGMILLGLTMLGGTLFSTLTNGVVAFMLFILAFLGGWTEQFGALAGNKTAVDIGIVSSLILPTEAVWKRAAYSDAAPHAGQRLLVPLRRGLGAQPGHGRLRGALCPGRAGCGCVGVPAPRFVDPPHRFLLAGQACMPGRAPGAQTAPPWYDSPM